MLSGLLHLCGDESNYAHRTRTNHTKIIWFRMKQPSRGVEEWENHTSCGTCLFPGLRPHDKRIACCPITVPCSLCNASSAQALQHYQCLVRNSESSNFLTAFKGDERFSHRNLSERTGILECRPVSELHKSTALAQGNLHIHKISKLREHLS